MSEQEKCPKCGSGLHSKKQHGMIFTCGSVELDIGSLIGTDICDARQQTRAEMEQQHAEEIKRLQSQIDDILIQLQRTDKDYLQKYAVVFQSVIPNQHEVVWLDDHAFRESKIEEKLVELGWAKPGEIDKQRTEIAETKKISELETLGGE